ncbi:MAG: crotonase/enoyl-CoA hydratase family protein [Bacteroidota bacterium]
MTFEHYHLVIEEHIATVEFARPEKANSLHREAWEELKAIFEYLNDLEDARVIILAGQGKHFCAGIDLELLMSIHQFNQITCEGRKREKIRQFIIELQDCINAIEKCRKPVLAAVHRACVGGGVDIISTCDMRYCTEDAFFSIKEIELGMVADLGTLQRLPKIIAPGIAAEMAYTGRKVGGREAQAIGLVNRCYKDKEDMMIGVREVAAMIATKSPLSIRGTKEILLHTRDHAVADGLNYMSTWNAAMLLSEDLMEAFQASMQKRAATFND